MTTDNKDDDIDIAEGLEPTEITAHNVTTEGKRQRLRRWIRKLAVILAVLGPLVFVIAALGYRIGLFDLGTSLMTLSKSVGPTIMVFGIIVSIVSIFLSLVVAPSTRKGLFISLIALVIPAIGLVKTMSIGSSVAKLPFIHDITTDTEDPPEFTQAIVDLRNKTENVNTLDYFEKKDPRADKLVSVQQSKYYKDIRPILRSDKPDEVFEEAKVIVESIGWDVVTLDEKKWLIEATDTTFWYGFKDDVIIRIRPSKNGGSVVDMRSVSRVGGSDLGANADRLRMLMEGLEEK